MLKNRCFPFMSKDGCDMKSVKKKLAHHDHDNI